MRRLNLKRASSGFTLIELIITIVIIGVLAAVAIPKFQSLTSDANKGVGEGVASALASATSVNYAKSKLNGATACAAGGTTGGATPTCSYWTLTSCTQLAAAASDLADMAGWTVDSATTGTLTSGVASANCKITDGKTPATLVNVNAYGT